MSGTKLLLPACFAAAFFCACAAPGQHDEGQVKPASPGAAVVFGKQVFKLSKTPDTDLEAALADLLSDSYQAAVKNHYGDKPMELGFTYSMAPKGAIYPFSEIEVSCIMQDKYARVKGPGLCGDFFAELDQHIKRALKKNGK